MKELTPQEVNISLAKFETPKENEKKSKGKVYYEFYYDSALELSIENENKEVIYQKIFEYRKGSNDLSNDCLKIKVTNSIIGKGYTIKGICEDEDYKKEFYYVMER